MTCAFQNVVEELIQSVKIDHPSLVDPAVENEPKPIPVTFHGMLQLAMKSDGIAIEEEFKHEVEASEAEPIVNETVESTDCKTAEEKRLNELVKRWKKATVKDEVVISAVKVDRDGLIDPVEVIGVKADRNHVHELARALQVIKGHDDDASLLTESVLRCPPVVEPAMQDFDKEAIEAEYIRAATQKVQDLIAFEEETVDPPVILSNRTYAFDTVNDIDDAFTSTNDHVVGLHQLINRLHETDNATEIQLTHKQEFEAQPDEEEIDEETIEAISKIGPSMIVVNDE